MTVRTPVIVRTAIIMGLPFSLHVRVSGRGGTPDTTAIDNAVQRVWADVRQADRVFSTYRTGSDTSRIRRGELRVQDADPAVGTVLDLAEVARRVTGGSFDVCAGGTLDPSGIVKSWAAVRAAEHLRELGMAFYLNAGGDILLRGIPAEHHIVSPDDPTSWRIGIEHPDDPAGLLAVLEVGDRAIATSGSVHRGAHILDPRTGSPATGIIQASVTGPSLVWADVLATAVVAGGMDRLDRAQWPPGYDLLLVTDSGKAFVSEGFPALFAVDVAAPATTPLPEATNGAPEL